MQKKLLILGAGIYQVPLILKAKEMGLYTIAASYAGPYPGLAVADETWEIDTTDYKKLLKKARGTKIDGVCTTGTDVSVISVGYLCQELGLNGISFAAASLATNKASMKDAFLAGGVSTPSACKVYSEEEALQAFIRMGSPVIVKAVDSSGSRGINRAETEAELLSAYAKAMEVTHKNYILIETFITAHEIGVDGLVSGGKVQLLLPHDKFTHTSGSTTLPEGHRFPYRCSDILMQKIQAETKLAVKALGLDNCAFNADILVTDDNAYILEMGGRAGATCIPELISIYTGLDYYAYLIRIALGETLSIDSENLLRRPCMAKLLFSKKDGVLSSIDTEALSLLCTENITVTLDHSAGASVSAVHNGTNRIGQVIVGTDNLEEMNQIMSAVRHTVKIDGVDLEKLWNE